MKKCFLIVLTLMMSVVANAQLIKDRTNGKIMLEQTAFLGLRKKGKSLWMGQ